MYDSKFKQKCEKELFIKLISRDETEDGRQLSQERGDELPLYAYSRAFDIVCMSLSILRAQLSTSPISW